VLVGSVLVVSQPAAAPPAAPTGWSITLPDLPAFRRKKALPERTGRPDPPPAFVASTILWGWHPDQPVTKAFRRYLLPTRISIQTPVPLPPIPPMGWTVELPRLRQRPVADLGAILLGTPLTAPPLFRAITPVLRSVNLRAVPPTFARAAMATTGSSLVWLPTVPAVPTGWSIVLPDLKAARHFQALPEFTGRIAFAAPVITAPFPYFTVEPPLLHKLNLTLSAIAAGSTFSPVPIIPMLLPGWSITLPDIPIVRHRLDWSLARLDQPAPPFISPVVSHGWQATLPDIRFARFNTLWWPEDSAALHALPLPPPPFVLPPITAAATTVFQRGTTASKLSADIVILEGAGAFVSLTQRLLFAWEPIDRSISIPTADIVLPYDVTVTCYSVIFDLSVVFGKTQIIGASVLAPAGSFDMVQGQIIASPVTGQPANAVKIVTSTSRSGGQFAIMVTGANGLTILRSASVAGLITDPIGSSITTAENFQALLMVSQTPRSSAPPVLGAG
jgi:phage tail protein X